MVFLTGNLKTEQLLDPPYNGDQYRLLEGIRYRLAGHDYNVPAGFISDGTSLPRLLRSLFKKEGRHSLAAWLHDYLYRTQTVTKKTADYIFYRAMLDLGVNRFKAYAFWMGVKAGGWIDWNRHAARYRDEQ